MNSWQLQISNNEIAGQRTEKMFPFIPIIFPVYGYSDLWTVRKIIRLHGGAIQLDGGAAGRELFRGGDGDVHLIAEPIDFDNGAQRG